MSKMLVVSHCEKGTEIVCLSTKLRDELRGRITSTTFNSTVCQLREDEMSDR